MSIGGQRTISRQEAEQRLQRILLKKGFLETLNGLGCKFLKRLDFNLKCKVYGATMRAQADEAGLVAELVK
jgi:hypothetical protein